MAGHLRVLDGASIMAALAKIVKGAAVGIPGWWLIDHASVPVPLDFSRGCLMQVAGGLLIQIAALIVFRR